MVTLFKLFINQFQVIFVPISHPVFSVFGVEKDCHIRNCEAWKPSNFIKSIDNVEKTVRNFGGAAAEVIIWSIEELTRDSYFCP